jgi:hypothetical protein
MNEQEKKLYQQIRDVPGDKSLAAAKEVMWKSSSARFKAENEARTLSMACAEPIHQQLRTGFEKNFGIIDFQAARERQKEVIAKQERPKLFIPQAPRGPRLKIGSVHLVDTAPFQSLTWQEVSTFGGSPSAPEPPMADGTTGNMSFDIAGGGGGAISNNSSVSCWCAIGQAYVFPPGLEKVETGGAMMRFSASPSFNWQAMWMSEFWRLASGNIWVGQLVHRFDSNWVFIDTPVSTQQVLESWNDYNQGDFTVQQGSSTSFGLTCNVFISPGFIYDCWVWVGATAYGDQVDAGWSGSSAFMTANVSSLIFDVF